MALSLQGAMVFRTNSSEKRDWAETILSEHEITYTVRNVSSMPPIQNPQPSVAAQMEMPVGEYVFFVRQEDAPLAEGLLKN